MVPLLNESNSRSPVISICDVMAAHGMHAERKGIENERDLNHLVGEVVQSLLIDNNHRTPSHPRIVVVVDMRLMEVVGYAVNPIYVAGYYATTPQHCIYQTANYLMPMNSKPTKNWQMKGNVKCKKRISWETVTVPVSLILTGNLLLFTENENGKGFEGKNNWIRLDRETKINKYWLSNNAFVINEYITFICSSESECDEWIQSIKKVIQLTTTTTTTAETNHNNNGDNNSNNGSDGGDQDDDEEEENEEKQIGGGGDGDCCYYYYIPRKGKGNKQKENNDDNNNVKDDQKANQQQQAPAPPLLSLADRIQPWTGASHPHCLSVIGGGGDNDNHPLVISFHCDHHLTEYWYCKGMVVRMMNAEMKEQIAREICSENGNDENEN